MTKGTDETKDVLPKVAETAASSNNTHIQRALYPLTSGLSKVLKVATGGVESSTATVLHKESPHTALQNVFQNCMTSLDQWYFSCSPVERKALQAHRTCLRVSTDEKDNSVTITDLGVGMTRADLINLLGVGKYHPQRKQESKLKKSDSHMTDSTESSREGSTSSSTGTSSSDSDDDSTHAPQKQDVPGMTSPPIAALPHDVYCRTKDVGGFYAAIGALAVGVKVGTKSKFDDYYEFQLGHTPIDTSSNGDDNLWNHFKITRPMDEGTQPGLHNGYTGLADLRGSSGTSVTLYLQPKYKEWTTDDGVKNILLPMVTKILETTPYTFVLDGIVSKDEAQALLQASEKEAETIQKLQEQEKENENDPPSTETTAMDRAIADNAQVRKTVLERAKYIPLRLSLDERKMLRLVEAAMNCCDYTTIVDQPGLKTNKRIHSQVKGILALLRGLVTACEYNDGQKLARQEAFNDAASYHEYLPFLRNALEIARRHKIMNPEKMRTEYGKLVYLLQDAVLFEQEGLLDYGLDDDEDDGGGHSNHHHHATSLIAPIKTVYKFLEDKNGLALLRDQHIEIATEEILATPGKTRHVIDQQIRRKELAVARLKRQYRSTELSTEDIHLCLYSICDNNSFLNSNRVPIDKVIEFLKTHFSPTKAAVTDEEYSLAIVKGQDGARLSHSHERQYFFALQSLTLWRDIIDDMFRLWAMAEHDLLNPSIGYNLQDTGQGMQRVQQSPQTYKAMQLILAEVQHKVQQWVGSSVIHLGDHNVPNALAFIDKYMQVPRILGPIVICLENLEKIVEKDVGIQDMVTEGFGGLEGLRKDILYDFFRSAFDGSGADNFYDAGSCIDGRMTSAWNWCSQLPTKPFYPIFKLTGFVGFDGEFK